MSLLNPWALALLLPLLWLFKSLLLKYTFKHLDFKKEQLRYYRQSQTLLFVLILCIIALSQPVIVNEISKEKFDANEYIIALDASYSMQADDIKPNRYTVAKQSIISLLQNNTQDRFSVFAFTSNPLLICPPTTDTAIAINALNALTPEYILTKGTSLRNLIQKISELEVEHKNLLIFSDGGDEHDLAKLISLSKKHAITVNIVALGSSNGAVLRKDNKPIHDNNGNLVVSRINPILKILANETQGHYFEINKADSDIRHQISDALEESSIEAKEQKVDILSYKELFYIPLLLAFIILFSSLTIIQKYLPFFALILTISPLSSAEASLLDFYYLNQANKAYSQKEYKKAAQEFEKVTPSQQSYLNIANSYYHNKQYQTAMKYYTQIQTKDRTLKQKLYFNMANCASHLKHYDRAKNYYQKALALGFHNESFENLNQLYALGIFSKVDVADMLPNPDAKEKQESSKKNERQKDDDKKETQGGKSNQQASQRSQGAGGNMKKRKKNTKKTNMNRSDKHYKMGYKAYELINKGYTNEQHPW